jgi:multiple sugar transport system substrate-binding protein
MKTTNRFVGLAIATSVILAACGGTPTTAPAPATEAPKPAEATQAPKPTEPPAPTEAPPPTEAPKATEAPAAPAGDVSLRWRTRPDNKEEAAVYAGISDDVAKKLSVKLTYEPGGTEGAGYQDQLKTELGAGTAPDVFWIPGTDIADFATKGLILDMRSIADANGHKDADFYPEPMFHLTYDPAANKAGGKLWGLPRDVSTFALYLNLDLINEAGAADPRELAKQGKWDWAAFEDVAKKVNALGGDVKGYGGSAWWGPYGAFMNAAGGGFFNADRSACNLNSKESIEGLGFLNKLYTDKLAVPYGEDPEPPFRAGKVAMFQNGRWATPGISTATFNWDVVELPKGPSGKSGNWLFWGAYVVNAKTKNPEAAVKLVQELTTAETQGKVAASGANVPSRKSDAAFQAFLGIEKFKAKNNQAFLNGLADSPAAEGPLWNGSWPDYSKAMDAGISSVLTGKTSIDDFAKVACDEPGKSISGAGAPAPAAAAANFAGTELRWRTRPDNKEEAAVYAGISDEVAKATGLKLTYEPGGTEGAGYQDQLKTELGAGTAPDVFWIPGTDVADFATKGLILDMRSIADKAGHKDADFYPEPMFHLTYDPEAKKAGGKLWGLPRDVSTFALYLNLDLINEAGAADPRELAKQGKWDWAAFEDVAKKVNALGGDVKGYGMNAWWGPYGAFMNAAGGGFFNADRSACNLTSKESVEGLTFARGLYDNKLAVPYGEDSEPPFRAGKVAMFQNGRWATPGISTVTFNWDVVELPKGPSGKAGNWLFWGAYVVNAKTKNPEAAFELVRQLTLASTQAKVAASGANVPSRKGDEAFKAFLGIEKFAAKNNQAFLNGLADSPAAEGPLWAGSWPDYSKAMDAGISAVMSGKTSVEDFAKTGCDEAGKAFTN